MKKHSINRRTILRGAGASLSLPLLEIMQPASAAVAPTAPTRMAFVFFPNGAVMDKWRPSGGEHDFKLNASMESLEQHRDDLLLFTGLTQHHARANGDGGGDHARCASAFLTGAQPKKTKGADIRVGQSVDQAAASIIGHQTRLPSLELGIERGRNAGSCDSGYSCAYSTNISWKSESLPNAKEIVPRLAFERMFGDASQAKDQKLRQQTRKSILDFVADDAQRLRKVAGGADRRKLDEYFNSVREIEQRMDRADRMAPVEIPEMNLPEGVPKELAEHLALMYDLMILAFQTDSTRIATFMVGDAGCNRKYREVGVEDGHHQLSHHQSKEEKLKQIAKIDKWLVEQFSAFLTRMKNVQEGEGNLLDNSMVLYGSGIADGMRHHHHDLPIVVAGKGGGSLNTGRYIATPNETPLNNLLLSMSERVGADLKELGDSTGALKL